MALLVAPRNDSIASLPPRVETWRGGAGRRRAGDDSLPASSWDQDAPCLFLPRPLWCLIIRHGLAAAAAEGHFEALRLAAVLLATSRHVAAACREVALHLDLSKAPEEDLALLLPLLTAVPLRQLLLAPWHAAGAEALLRCDAVVALSAPTLRHLAATVACTDTLQASDMPGAAALYP